MTTKQRMIQATVASLRRRGLAGTSFTEVLDVSGAARGAIYHHFPGGKAELVEVAVRVNGAMVAEAFAGLAASATIAEVVDAFLAAVAPAADEAAAGASCAIGGVAVDADGGSALQVACNDGFNAWRAALEVHLQAAGADERRARELSATLVMMLEGAHVLCRAAGSPTPFHEAARELRRAYGVMP